MATLIKFESSISGIDLLGYQIVDDNEAERIRRAIELLDYPHQFYFGHDNYIEFSSSRELLYAFEFDLIPDEKSYQIVRELLLKSDDQRGWTPIDIIRDELSEDAYLEIWENEDEPYQEENIEGIGGVDNIWNR